MGYHQPVGRISPCWCGDSLTRSHTAQTTQKLADPPQKPRPHSPSRKIASCSILPRICKLQTRHSYGNHLLPLSPGRNTHLRVCETREQVWATRLRLAPTKKLRKPPGKQGMIGNLLALPVSHLRRPAVCPLGRTLTIHNNSKTMLSASIALVLLGARHASGFFVSPGGALARTRLPTAGAARRCGGASTVVEMSATKLVPFSKYQGLGNDFILVDNREAEEPMLTAGESADLCDR